MRFSELEDGARFVFVGADQKECTKVDAQHYAYYRYQEPGGTPEEQEAVAYGRVGVGDNPVKLLAYQASPVERVE